MAKPRRVVGSIEARGVKKVRIDTQLLGMVDHPKGMVEALSQIPCLNFMDQCLDFLDGLTVIETLSLTRVGRHVRLGSEVAGCLWDWGEGFWIFGLRELTGSDVTSEKQWIQRSRTVADALDECFDFPNNS